MNISNIKKLLYSSIIGNALEFYDLGIYGFLAPVMSTILFPEQDPYMQMLSSMGVFSIGFLARPIGGIFFGHLGDKYGRKYSLSLTILCMSFATLLIGLLPSYSEIGLTTFIFLLVLRFLQGVCAGGEYTGAVILFLENGEEKRHSFFGSLLTSSAVFGFFFAGIVTYLSFVFGDAQSYWRIPFLVGSMLSILGFYIRFKIFESPQFLAAQSKESLHQLPLFEALVKNWPSVFCTMGIAWCIGTFSLNLIGYFPTYFTQVLGLKAEVSKQIHIAGLLIFSLALPPLAVAADKMGPFNFMKAVNLLVLLVIIPLFKLFSAQDVVLVCVATSIFGLLCSLVAAPMHAVMMRLFPVSRRFSGIAFSYTFGLAIFASTAPMINTFLVEYTGLNYAPSFYFFISSVVGLLSATYGEKIAQNMKH